MQRHILAILLALLLMGGGQAVAGITGIAVDDSLADWEISLSGSDGLVFDSTIYTHLDGTPYSGTPSNSALYGGVHNIYSVLNAGLKVQR